MQRYLVRRLLALCTNLFLVSVFTFSALRLIPGDVTGAVLGQTASPAQIQAFRHSRGLDRPPAVQYVRWIEGALSGDLGKSFITSTPVSSDFAARLPVTLEVVFLSFFFATSIGLVFGALSALRQGSSIDHTVRLISFLGLSIPNFLILTCLLIFPALWWGYAPPFGATRFAAAPFDNLRLFLPATLALAFGASATQMRFNRSAFLEVMRQDYVRTARAKGLRDWTVVVRHEVRNALAPVLTLAGLQLGTLLSGSIILEQILGLPGLGTWTLASVTAKDYPVVMAVTLYAALAVMLISLAVDLLYAVIDPRVRYA